MLNPPSAYSACDRSPRAQSIPRDPQILLSAPIEACANAIDMCSLESSLHCTDSLPNALNTLAPISTIHSLLKRAGLAAAPQSAFASAQGPPPSIIPIRQGTQHSKRLHWQGNRRPTTRRRWPRPKRLPTSPQSAAHWRIGCRLKLVRVPTPLPHLRGANSIATPLVPSGAF